LTARYPFVVELALVHRDETCDEVLRVTEPPSLAHEVFGDRRSYINATERLSTQSEQERIFGDITIVASWFVRWFEPSAAHEEEDLTYPLCEKDQRHCLKPVEDSAVTVDGLVDHRHEP